jgi:urease accessory protein
MTRRLGPLDPDQTVYDTLVLSIDQRERTRFRARLSGGESVGVMIDRGGPSLRPGEGLSDDDGVIIRVEAAAEAVSTVRASDALGLVRAAYHLGNRHTSVELSAGCLRYRQDHVLDSMIEGLGLALVHETVPFHPEPGAYHAGHAHE